MKLFLYTGKEIPNGAGYPAIWGAIGPVIDTFVRIGGKTDERAAPNILDIVSTAPELGPGYFAVQYSSDEPTVPASLSLVFVQTQGLPR